MSWQMERHVEQYGVGLGHFSQGKYAEAQHVLQQVAPRWEYLLGAAHVDTLNSKTWLGLALYNQKKFSEAEEVLREVVPRHEEALGKNHWTTLKSKHWLGAALNAQNKHIEANTEARELLQHVFEHREMMLGADHKDTLESKALLQKIIKTCPPATTTCPVPETVSGRLSDFFANDSHKPAVYTDAQIQQVARLLCQFNLQWSKVPRLYIILRTIDCLAIIDAVIDAGCSDYWLPFTEQGLPSCLHPSKRSRFVAAQTSVMTNSMDLEKGEEGRHCHFREQDPLPFEIKGLLGSGGFGQVHRVLSTTSFREYALKRVSRRDMFGGRIATVERKRACVKQFIAEIEVLKRLKHRHVVEFMGSYTDAQYIGLIMSPVADMDLSAYLARADLAVYKEELRTFFGCLTRGLEFLHGQNIRHKDIKPQNILIHSGNVLFTDFGLAFDFTDQDGSTTVSMVNGMTAKYCAPEVANYEPRNTSSDIWSLGVVFLEMVAVLKGKTVEQVYDFLRERGSRQASVRANIDGTHLLIAELRTVGSPTDNAVLGWIQDMVVLQPQVRPTVTSLMASIISASQKGGRHEAFCGICCASLDGAADEFEDLEMIDSERSC